MDALFQGNLFVGETYYGGFLELGTKWIKARGFMERAFEVTKNQQLAAINRVLRTEILAAVKAIR